MRIFIDSTVIISDFLLKSINSKLFLTHYQKVPAKIYISQIVIDEVVNKYSEKLIEYEKQLTKKHSEINRMLIEQHNQKVINSDDAVIEYKNWLNNLIKEKNIEILPYPSISLETMIKHDLNRMKPFKETGSGYRDYLIFYSIMDHFDVHYDSAVFISANKSDFFQDDKIHPDLFKIKTIRHTNDIEGLYSLKEFNERYLSQYIQPTHEKVEIIYKKHITDLEDYIRHEILNILRNNDDFEHVIDFSNSGVHLSHIDKILDVHYEVAYKSNSGYKIVNADVTFNGTLSISISNEDVEYDETTSDFVGDYYVSDTVDIDTKDEIHIKFEFRIDSKMIEDVIILELETSFGMIKL